MKFHKSKESVNAITLLAVLNIIETGSHKEPDPVSEEKVDLTGAAQDVAELLYLNLCQLWIQIEAAKLRNEKFKIRARYLTA